MSHIWQRKQYGRKTAWVCDSCGVEEFKRTKPKDDMKVYIPSISPGFTCEEFALWMVAVT